MPEISEDQKPELTDSELLERAEAEHEQAEAERIAAESKVRQERDKLARTQHLQRLREALDSRGTKWYMPSAEIAKLLEAEPGFRFQIDAEPAIDGRIVSLDQMLESFEARHQHLHEQTLAQREENLQQKKYGSVKSLNDIPSLQDRVGFINRFGLSAFESLATHGTPQKSWTAMSTAEYSRLPVSEKVGIVAKYGSDQVSRTLSSNDDKDRQRRERERREELLRGRR